MPDLPFFYYLMDRKYLEWINKQLYWMSDNLFELPPITKNQGYKSFRSNPKQQKKNKIGAYIDNSLTNINNGCYREGQLCIDGGYGDYRMSIFRVKDRKKKFFEIPTIFTQTFIKNIEEYSPQGKQFLHHIIAKKNDEYLQSRVEESQSKNKDNQKNLAQYEGQDEEYLYHQYVSDYQKERWFKKITPLPQAEEVKTNQVGLTQRPQRKKKALRNENTHFFRYLENKFFHELKSR